MRLGLALRAAVVAMAAGVLLLRGAWPARAPIGIAAQASLPSCQPSSPQVLSQDNPILQDAGVQQAIAGLDALEQVRDNSNLPSLSVALVYGGDTIWARGFGCADLTKQTPATPDTVYGVGSVTKMFTAVMLMQLVDAGMVALNDPVNVYLPGAEYKSPTGGTVSPTFLQLADHTSGLPDEPTAVPSSLNDLLQQLQGITALSEPGTTYLYSNWGYMLLGQVLASVAGESYEDYVDTHILQPLGMTSSAFSDSTATPPNGATPYVSPTQAAAYLNQGLLDPAGGLNSTVADIAQFVKLALSDGTVNGATILSPSAMQQMLQVATPAGPAPLTGIGVGWQFYTPEQGLSFVGKDGFIQGFIGDIVFVPGTNVGVYVVTNIGNPQNPGTVPLVMLQTAEAVLAQVMPAMQKAAGAQ